MKKVKIIYFNNLKSYYFQGNDTDRKTVGLTFNNNYTYRLSFYDDELNEDPLHDDNHLYRILNRRINLFNSKANADIHITKGPSFSTMGIIYFWGFILSCIIAAVVIGFHDDPMKPFFFFSIFIAAMIFAFFKSRSNEAAFYEEVVEAMGQKV